MSDGLTPLQRWLRVHRAAVEAGETEDAAYAQEQIERLNRLATTVEAGEMADRRSDVGKMGAFAANLLHGASLGTGELASGVGGILGGLRGGPTPGTNFASGAESYRNAIGAIQEAQPTASLAGDVAGSMVVPFPGAQAGFQAARAATTAGRVAPVVKPLIRGAREGAILAGTRGFAEGGGGLEERAGRAAQVAPLGAVVGVLAGYLGRRSGIREGERALDLRAKVARTEGAERYAAGPTRGTGYGPGAARASQSREMVRIQEAGRARGRADAARMRLSRVERPSEPMGPRPGTAERTPPGHGQLTGGSREVIPSGQRGPVKDVGDAVRKETGELPTTPTTDPDLKVAPLKRSRMEDVEPSPKGARPPAPGPNYVVPPSTPETLAAAEAAAGGQVAPLKQSMFPAVGPVGQTPRQAARRAAREAYVQVDVAGGGKEAAKSAARRGAAMAEAAAPPAPRLSERQIEDLAGRIAVAPDDLLLRELGNPMVDDAVKEVARQELLRRGVAVPGGGAAPRGRSLQ